METLKLLFLIYLKPGFAFSEIMDRGSWLIAAAVTLVVGILFFFTVNAKLVAAYQLPVLSTYYNEVFYSEIDVDEAERYQANALRQYQEAVRNKQQIPIVGDSFFTFFSFEPTAFYRPLIAISLFFVPAVLLCVSLFGGIASFGLLLRRDYAVIATCTLLAWSAAHLPFAVAGVALFGSSIDPSFWLSLWVASGALFGILMLFAIRTVFGTTYAVALIAVGLSWPAFPLAMYVVQFIGPWLLSPFLLLLVIFYFGGFLGGQVQGFGSAFRQRQSLKRFLQNATINPRDADAHVQLGIIYLERRQETRAVEHFTKAIEIDSEEIDANYELGRIARGNKDLQKALDHFAVVVEQNDKFRLSEIWREIGATYLDAGMLNEAYEPLEKFVERRPVDPEGLYYFGKLLKAKGEEARAREMFESAIENARTSPYFRSRNLGQWAKLAAKEL
ncbi:MAG: tetratricopeptide repeat protein [Acidobacteria bacterium]|nr:tetratricopeptide repeat protein [Acidobacteriota bacterium]